MSAAPRPEPARGNDGDPEAARGHADYALNPRPPLFFAALLAAAVAAALGAAAIVVGAARPAATASAFPPGVAGPKPAPLQTDPAADLAALRAREDALLSSYAWVDRAQGVARIPLERALSLYAAHPELGPGPAPAPAAPRARRRIRR